MMVLRKFVERDIPILQKYKYENISYPEMKALIGGFNSEEYEGKYYEAFAITDGKRLVGFISLYQHAETIVSCGVEIFIDYQRRNYAFCAMKEVLQIARDKGYRIVLDQIRTNNTASIALHKKLGFEADDYVYKNRRGNSVSLFLKIL